MGNNLSKILVVFLHRLRVFGVGKKLSYTFEITSEHEEGMFLFILNYDSSLLPNALIHTGVFKDMTYGESFTLMIEAILIYWKDIGVVKTLIVNDIINEINYEPLKQIWNEPLKTMWEMKKATLLTFEKET